MDSSLYIPFVQGSREILKQMVDLDIQFSQELNSGQQEITSLGVSSIITFTGMRSGRFLIDMEPKLALHITKAVTGEEFESVQEYDVLTTISELNNIIAGDGITRLNDIYNWSLRLAPPIVLSGDSPLITVPKINSTTIEGQSEYGDLKIDIAFVREG